MHNAHANKSYIVLTTQTKKEATKSCLLQRVARVGHDPTTSGL